MALADLEVLEAHGQRVADEAGEVVDLAGHGVGELLAVAVVEGQGGEVVVGVEAGVPVLGLLERPEHRAGGDGLAGVGHGLLQVRGVGEPGREDPGAPEHLDDPRQLRAPVLRQRRRGDARRAGSAHGVCQRWVHA